MQDADEVLVKNMRRSGQARGKKEGGLLQIFNCFLFFLYWRMGKGIGMLRGLGFHPHYGFRGPTTLPGGLWDKKQELLVENCNWFPQEATGASWLAEVPRSGRDEGTRQRLMNH